MDAFSRVKVIGKGAFGAAILVKRDGQNYVIKEVVLEGLSSKEKLEAQNEAKLLRQLDHGYIVKYVDSGVQHGKLWIAMEFCSGGDLDEYVNAKRKQSQFFSEAEALGVFAQVCLALSYIHDRHILHRDLKSKNIFLSAPAVAGKAPIVKLGDFGIAKVLANTRDKAKTQIGTPYYLSPEICEDKPYGTKSDVWAMGCILYELLALKVPFTAKDLHALVRRIMHDPTPALPAQYRSVEGLGVLFEAMMRKDSNKRPSIQEVLAVPCINRAVQLLPQQGRPAAGPAPAAAAAPAAAPSNASVPSSAPTAASAQARPPSLAAQDRRRSEPPAAAPAPAPSARAQAAAPASSKPVGAPPARVVRGGPSSVLPAHPTPAARPGPRPHDVAKQQLEEWRAKYKDEWERGAPPAAAPPPVAAARPPPPSSGQSSVHAVNDFMQRQAEARRNAQRFKTEYEPSPAAEPPAPEPTPRPTRPGAAGSLSASQRLAVARADFMDRQQAARRNAARAVDDPAPAPVATPERNVLLPRRQPPPGRLVATPPMETTIVLSRGKPESRAERVREQKTAAKEHERAQRERELADARRVAFEERVALKNRIEAELGGAPTSVSVS